MGRFAEAADAAPEKNRGGQQNGLERIFAALPDEDADDLRTLFDSDMAPSVLYRLVRTTAPEQPWPTDHGFYQWVRQWRTNDRRF